MPEGWVAFLSGVITVLITAQITRWFQRGDERHKKVQEVRAHVYMSMLDLYNAYFWFTVAEFHKEEIKPHHIERCRKLGWEMCDKVRESDDASLIEQVAHVVFSNTYPTATARYDAMGKIVDQLGKAVNPNYVRIVSGIQTENQRLFLGNPERKSNAPGSAGVI